LFIFQSAHGLTTAKTQILWIHGVPSKQIRTDEPVYRSMATLLVTQV
jgi:hypothetical protein